MVAIQQHFPSLWKRIIMLVAEFVLCLQWEQSTKHLEQKVFQEDCVAYMFKPGVSKVQYHLTRAQRRFTIEVFENMGTALVKKWLQHRPHCDWWTDCHLKFKLWVSAKSQAAFSALVLAKQYQSCTRFFPIKCMKEFNKKRV